MIGQEVSTTSFDVERDPLVGRSPRMLELREAIDRAARGAACVILLGESGSGKEVVARSIHARDALRRSEPFLAMNCGAFTRELLPSTLFGHRRGAFTGAVADQDGVFVGAGRGVLFLDEIAEMPLDLQVQLLRAIDEREVTPVGGNDSIPWRARLVCATNRDLRAEVAAGRFREDLFYRINVVAVSVPPLRDRRGDVPLLVERFLDDLAASGTGRKQLSTAASAALLAHNWPGNVRELRNVVERACAFSVGATIESVDLRLDGDSSAAASAFPTLDEIVAEHIRAALATSGGVRTRAARLLGVDRNRLSRMIRRLGIK